MKDKPYWYKLISYWVKKRKRTGLTIPFIIGSKSYFDKLSNIDTIFELFDDIRNSDIDEPIVLSYCQDVREYVLGLNNQHYLNCKVFQNESNGKATLIATLNTESLGKDFNVLVNSLEERYEEEIANKKYSKESNKWIPFTSNDVELINAAKNE